MTEHRQRIARVARLWALGSGLVIFAFAALELVTDAVGLVSLDTMGRIADWRDALLQSSPCLTILTLALASHIGATLWLTASRGTLRMSWQDALEIISGILVPLLLLPAMVDTAGAAILFGVTDDTLYRLAKLWPERASLYVALIALLWAHGCLGLHQALRPRPGYARIAPLLGVIALALPIAAIAGLIASARVAGVLVADEQVAAQIRSMGHWPSPEAEAILGRIRLLALSVYGVVLLAAAVALVTRLLRIVVAPKIDVTYVNGPTLKTAIGPTLLEISRIHDLSHGDGCGGRGRCTACSVRIEHGIDTLPPAGATERAMLGDADSQVRLACQIWPTASLTVTRLAAAHGDPAAAGPDIDASGIERQVVALCIQLRDHAALARNRAAYDAIFLLNAFLDAAHEAVTAHHGWVAHTSAGGLIAVFGREDELGAACRSAVAASAAMDVALDRLNERFAAELGRPVEAAMGLVSGPAYIGRLGAGPAKTLSAIGVAIDLASVLAAQAARRGTQLLADPAVFRHAGIDASACEVLALGDGAGAHDVFALAKARVIPLEPI
ncbi:adenylate/guanylate cyclase domain-containing protein [Bradyrhizobium sp. HKCCYLS20291]|uniref:adenylate/guanylate cyclase domain-containing protein n=1 Tax=Bradyrhizobium sp. HKCCYLS20291 TaxID=3420766 RepID=UPI003EB8BB92